MKTNPNLLDKLDAIFDITIIIIAGAVFLCYFLFFIQLLITGS